MGSDPWHTDDGIELSLPEWVVELREHQDTAIDAVVDAFKRVDVVFLDAPTGAGKTLIAEIVRQRMQRRAMYMASSISLQHQFTRDFPYARLLKGRSNYPTATRADDYPMITAADCTKEGGDNCLWCPDVPACPYEAAKQAALRADLAVVNTKYFLTEANYVGTLSKRPLVIADECDLLEGELLSFVEFNVTQRRLKALGLEAPKKGVHQTTIVTWLQDELEPAAREAARRLRGIDDVKLSRDRRSLQELAWTAKYLASELDEEVINEMTGTMTKNWVRDYAGPFTMKPVKANRYGKPNLWCHSAKWLLMSATIISADEMADSLGLTVPYETVSVPMTFPVENRRLIVAPVANMAQKHREAEWPKMAHGVARVLDRHPDDRVLVHCVSYSLTEYLADELDDSERPVIRYTGASDRERALRDFRRSRGAVLLAPSFERGIDLVGDDCRVVIVAKVPFPNLGDQQVSAKLHSDGGQMWYSVATVRSLVQMTGRAVRDVDDHATTYILDRQFVSNVLKKNRFLLPAWWRDALVMDFPVNELIG